MILFPTLWDITFPVSIFIKRINDTTFDFFIFFVVPFFVGGIDKKQCLILG